MSAQFINYKSDYVLPKRVVGALYRWEDKILLATYTGFVNLDQPSQTWDENLLCQRSYDLTTPPRIERLPRGTRVEFISEV